MEVPAQRRVSARFSNQTNTFQIGYDPSYYDARARLVYGTVTYAFKGM